MTKSKVKTFIKWNKNKTRPPYFIFLKFYVLYPNSQFMFSEDLQNQITYQTFSEFLKMTGFINTSDIL